MLDMVRGICESRSLDCDRDKACTGPGDGCLPGENGRRSIAAGEETSRVPSSAMVYVELSAGLLLTRFASGVFQLSSLPFDACA